MKRLTGALAALGFLVLGFSAPLLAGPVSTCTGGAGNVSCDFYETNADGNPSEISSIAQIDALVGWGVVLVLEMNGDPNNRATWSDELIFPRIRDTAFANSAFLVSDGCNTGIEGDLSCFVDPFSVPHAIVFEDANGFVLYSITGNNYRIHSDGDVPEPATLALVGLALAGLGVVRRRRTQD